MARALQMALAGAWAAALAVVASAPVESPIRFTDAAASAGLTVANTHGGRDRKDYIVETTGNGAAVFDYNGDGWSDVLVTNGTTLAATSPTPPQLYRNDGTGRFTEVAAKAGLAKSGWGQGVCVGDYDNDGRPDLLLTYYGTNALYRNRGDETFVDATAAAKLPVTGTRYGSGCAFLDFDRDGHLDLFVANYVDLDLAKTPKPGQDASCQWKGLAVMCGPRGLPLARNALYRNNRDGTFTDVSEAAGILKPGGRYGLGVAVADFDGDGWVDVYVACDMTPSLLYRNRRDGTFEERGVEAGVAYNADGRLQAGMGVAVGDYDGNGQLDLAKTNFSGDLPSLYGNEDGRFFTDVSRQAGLGIHQLLGWGIAFLDCDEDGWLDLLIANGHVYPEVDRAAVGDRYLQRTLLYRNLGNGRFTDATAAAGPAFDALRPARGLATGDLDGDGRPEVVLVNMNQAPSLLRQEGAVATRALLLDLVGTKSNRSAVGATVSVEAGGRRWVQAVMSGGSYYSHHSFTLHFGLGRIGRVDRVEVRWPNGGTQEWRDLPVNQRLTLTEGSPETRSVPLKNRLP